MTTRPLFALGADPEGLLTGVEHDLALVGEVPGAIVVGRDASGTFAHRVAWYRDDQQPVDQRLDTNRAAGAIRES